MDKIDYDEIVELHGNADTNPQIETSQMYDIVLLDTPSTMDAVKTVMKEWVPVRQASAMIRRFDGETFDIEDIEKIYQLPDFPSRLTGSLCCGSPIAGEPVRRFDAASRL